MLQQLEIFFEHSTFSLAMCIWSSQIIDQNPLTYPLDRPLVVFHSETKIQHVSGFFEFLNTVPRHFWTLKNLEFGVLKLFSMGLITCSTNHHQSIMHYQRLCQFILYFCHFATEFGVPLQILYFSALVRILLVVTLDSSTTCSRTVLLSTSLGIDRIKSTPFLATGQGT